MEFGVWNLVLPCEARFMLANFFYFVKKYRSDIILLVAIILISLLSFAVGYITAKIQEKEPLKIEKQSSQHFNI